MYTAGVPTTHLCSKSMAGKTEVVNWARRVSYGFSEAEVFELAHERRINDTWEVK